MSDEKKLEHAKKIGFDVIKDTKRVKLSKKVAGVDFSSIKRDLDAINEKEKKANDKVKKAQDQADEIRKECAHERLLKQGERDEMARLIKQHRIAQFLQAEYHNDPLFKARVDQADQPSPEAQDLLIRGMCLVCKTRPVSSTCSPCGDRAMCRDCVRISPQKKCPACRATCTITQDKTYAFGTTIVPR